MIRKIRKVAGLSISLFYFPNYAKYTDVTPENATRAIAPQEFGMWVLTNLATVPSRWRGLRNPLPTHRRISSLGSRRGDRLSQTQNLRADHPPAAEEATLPMAPWIERCLPGRGVARHDIANSWGGVPNALHWSADPDGVRRLARACEQKPDRQS